MFTLGTRVYENDSRSTDFGRQGTVVQINHQNPYPYLVLLDGDQFKFWHPAKFLSLTKPELPRAAAVTEPDASSAIFSVGGIHIAIENETPIIPTMAAIERVEQMERKMVVCRRCGCSDLFDGAMFTTGGGDICDDCF